MDTDSLVKGLSSFFVPGLGQMINGEFGKGLKFLIGFIVIWFVLLLTNIAYIQTVFGLIVRAFSAYDAYTHTGN